MLYTIGHSNHEMAAFVAMLQMYGITALGDVRSNPYSRHVKHFSYKPLSAELARAGIAYLFFGKELGARSDNPACYVDGRVQYDRLAREPRFAEGLERVLQGMNSYRMALMCSERDPLHCHRALLVARELSEMGVVVGHIHADGTIESRLELESRLLLMWRLTEGPIFRTAEERLSEAYKLQSSLVGYHTDSLSKEEGFVAIPSSKKGHS